MRQAGVGVLAVVVAACGGGGSPSPAPGGALPAGVVGRVGPTDVRAEEIARVAAAQRLDAAAARDAVVRDELLARGAESAGLADSADGKLAASGVLARRVLADLLRKARATPPTPEELAAAHERKWLEVDRPEAFRTVHAVVRFDASADEAVKARAMEIAARVRAAVLPVSEHAGEHPLPEYLGAPLRTTLEDRDPLSAAFQNAAKTVPHDGVEVVVQPLPPVAADGRVVLPNEGTFDPQFAKIAASLGQRGELSPVAVSSFGAHVMMLLDRVPGTNLTEEQRAARLRDDVVNERARAAEKKLLAGLRAQRSIATDAEGLLALGPIGP